MKPTSSLSDFIIFSILIALPLHLQAKKVSLEQNCKRISTANISQATCLEYFKADPGSKNTNLHTLGVIALKRTLQNVTDVKSVIQGHIGSNSSDAARIANTAMKSCLSFYNKALESANEALKLYEAKEYQDSAALTRQLDLAPVNCELDCKTMQVQSPLGPENEGFMLNALISSRIVDLLAAKKSKKTPLSPPPSEEAPNTYIEYSCHYLVSLQPNKIPREFCLSALALDPASNTTSDLYKVTGMVYKLTVNNATGIVSTIKNLLRSASGAVKSSLEDCLEFYNDKVGAAKRGLSMYEQKDYLKGEEEALRLPEAATMCEETFKKQKVQSPLTMENENFRMLSTMLRNVTNFVVQNEESRKSHPSDDI